jgi:Raf kinase inhibitor-like YbhB/YbcL family protein
MTNSVERVTGAARRRRFATATIAVSSLALLAACSTDGREMRPPRPDQTQTIIDVTVPDPVVADETVTTNDVNTPIGAFTLSAPWTDGGPIPVDHTCSGDGVSPSLVWSGAPIETESFALVVTDLDALGPTGDPLVHWVVANIDPFVTALPTGGAVPGAIEGVNDLGRPDVPIVGWSPPCPPVGETHTYAFTLHALGQRLDLVDGTPGADLIRAVELASLSSSTVTGTVAS